ncbi:unnamed protein product [Rangifer tarandus platyrhynchus]|uniref:Secreted protein n=2 Tax=Rangifer tarandus platyrhynchus TaxID=3082113 RepID=A0ABN8Y142_RANTA|nr:unnamed protein product [Rangifer tarandus platyrhynchus]CAI9692925.1 unnamed protein product [Rangifer tarandus platyrhynchus]
MGLSWWMWSWGRGALRPKAAGPTALPQLFPTSGTKLDGGGPGPDRANGRMCRRAERRRGDALPSHATWKNVSPSGV